MRPSSTRPAGFEPATSALGKRCSIQLSYERQGEELYHLTQSQVAQEESPRRYRDAEGYSRVLQNVFCGVNCLYLKSLHQKNLFSGLRNLCASVARNRFTGVPEIYSSSSRSLMTISRTARMTLLLACRTDSGVISNRLAVRWALIPRRP